MTKSVMTCLGTLTDGDEVMTRGHGKQKITLYRENIGIGDKGRWFYHLNSTKGCIEWCGGGGKHDYDITKIIGVRPPVHINLEEGLLLL